MKIYLSDETVKLIIKNDCDIASAIDDIEAELMEKVKEEICGGGELNVSRKTFNFISSLLDWYVRAYYSELEAKKE